MLREETITEQLTLLLRRPTDGLPPFLVYKLADRATAGLPDISVTYQVSGWAEIKATEVLGKLEKCRELQRFTCQQFEFTTGKSWFIIYTELPTGEKLTDIVLPSKIHNKRYTEVVRRFPGFNHELVMKFLRENLAR